MGRDVMTCNDLTWTEVYLPSKVESKMHPHRQRFRTMSCSVRMYSDLGGIEQHPSNK